MLHLIGYDLGSKEKDNSKVYRALEKAIIGLAGGEAACHKVPGGPWLLKTQESIERVLIEVDRKVAAALRGLKPPLTRKLLALTLVRDDKELLLGAHRELNPTANWLSSKGFTLHDDGWYAPRVLAIDFTLRGLSPEATARENRKLRMAIWHRFHGCCNPLHTLWFVHTSLPPEEVCRYLETFLPQRKAGKGVKAAGELLVLHARGPAVESGLERVRADVGWLWENGISVKDRWPD
jgi:hypothetical protein